MASRRRTVHALRKLLVRTDGKQWALFNGAWREPDEQDTSWIDGPAAC